MKKNSGLGCEIGIDGIYKECKHIESYLFLSLFFLILPEAAFATHESDHRYVISGYVRDASGMPLEGASVELEHKGGEKKKIVTGSGGYYEVLFHLHNENLGDEILVKVAETEKKIKVLFDPADKASARGDTVDFGSPPADVDTWVYLTGASLLLLSVVLYFGLIGKVRKKKVQVRSHPVKKGRKKQ